MQWEIWLDDTGKCDEWTLVSTRDPNKSAAISNKAAKLIHTFEASTYEEAKKVFLQTQESSWKQRMINKNDKPFYKEQLKSFERILNAYQDIEEAIFAKDLSEESRLTEINKANCIIGIEIKRHLPE
jgi:uncharacterized protein with ParB-like and HNH nuclease domain